MEHEVVLKCTSKRVFPIISRESAILSVPAEKLWNIALAEEGEPRAA